MRTFVTVALVAAAGLSAGTASAEQVALAPSAVKALEDSTNQGHRVVLLGFELPGELTGATILRATLRYQADCPAGGGVPVWAQPAPAAWDATADWGWWEENEALAEVEELVSFDSGECGDAVVHLEVARWMRGWVSGSRDNYGVVLRTPSGSEGDIRPVPGDQYQAPELRITYRPAEPNE